jgi:hypothetical protein
MVIGMSSGRLGAGRDDRLVSDAELAARLRHQQARSAVSVTGGTQPPTSLPLLPNIARGVEGGAGARARVGAAGAGAGAAAAAAGAGAGAAGAAVAVPAPSQVIPAVQVAPSPVPKPAFVALPQQAFSGTAADPQALAAGDPACP